ncbi:MAG TPA: hypothetical protein DDW50_10755 [Firmicutes bacterium]|jgi:HD-GYP domain-containing protein (c-di-GMP phosphodiesterase class II)|nr:hypothetical protein [Bacillota bacterium]
MKLISLNKITDNMVLAKNVYAREGNVLLAKEAPLKQNYATKLQEWGVNSVYVQDNQGDQLEIDEDLCQQAKGSVLTYLHEFLADLNQNQLSDLVRQTLETIITQILTDRNVLWNLVEMRAVSEDIFRHSVNVSVLSLIIGSFRGYTNDRLTELATGAILIDLGKITVAHELLDDPKISLTKENIGVQEHTRLGFEKLKQLRGNYETAAQVVLQHHEKYDGTGYPQGFKGEQIHEYARIASIADIFNLQKRGMQNDSPTQVITNGGGTSFDPELAKLFSQKIAPFFDNTSANMPDTTPAGQPSDQEQQKSPDNSDADAKLKKPSAVEYRHDSRSKQDMNSASFFSKMKGYFANKEHHAVEETDPKQTNRQAKVNAQNGNSDKTDKGYGDKFVVYPEWCQYTQDIASKIITKELSKISSDLIPKAVIETTQKTMEELLADHDLISNMVMIQVLDENIFLHAITVGMLSVMTGASMGYTQEQLNELGTGALLIDVGKVEISRRYNVDSRFAGTAEYEALMHEHTQLGFEQLWEMRPNTNIPYIALQHHEHYDGTGYPTGLKNRQINELARIVVLAEAYDSLIYEGIEGQKLMPHEVIEYIRDLSGSHFDPEISPVFLQNTIPFLVGSNVLLNTGETATIIKINKNLLARPLVRLILDKDGNKLSTLIAKDLATDLTLFIVAALKDEVI